jgi:hypothetical protein
MDVVERYLLNVRRYLPTGRADDLVAELGENIRAEVEDREERAGRPLLEEERVGLLRAHGHPFVVAGRFRSDGRRLVLGSEVIGPALFPYFRLALIAAGAVTGLVLAFGATASMIGLARPVPWFRPAVFWLSLQLGLATAIFAGLEIWFRRTAQTWDPRRLPVPRRPATPGSLRIQAAIQLVAIGIVLWIWAAVPDPLVLLGPRLADLRPGPAWRLLYLGVWASTVLSLFTPALTLIRPGLHRFRWLVSLFSTGAFIAFAAASLWSGAWVLPADPRSGIEVVDLAIGINAGFKFGLGLTVVVTGLATVVEVAIGLWRELRRPPGEAGLRPG